MLSRRLISMLCHSNTSIYALKTMEYCCLILLENNFRKWSASMKLRTMPCAITSDSLHGKAPLKNLPSSWGSTAFYWWNSLVQYLQVSLCKWNMVLVTAIVLFRYQFNSIVPVIVLELLYLTIAVLVLVVVQ